MVTGCTTHFKVDQQDVIEPVLGTASNQRVTLHNTGTGRLSIVLGGGKCEVMLRNIQSYASSIGNTVSGVTQLDSITLGLSGEIEKSFGSGVLTGVKIDVSMEQFGAKIQFNDAPASATAGAAAYTPSIVGVGAFRGRVSLVELPPIFAGLNFDIPPISLVFQKLGDAPFDHFFDMDLSALSTAIISFVDELAQHFNIGLPDLISGTRAMTMPIPRVVRSALIIFHAVTAQLSVSLAHLK